jgi:hypothetical protein
MDYIESLQDAIRKAHGCQSKHVERVPILETFQGQTVWNGAVEVFELVGHPKAKLCYAWGHAAKDTGNEVRICDRARCSASGFPTQGRAGVYRGRCQELMSTTFITTTNPVTGAITTSAVAVHIHTGWVILGVVALLLIGWGLWTLFRSKKSN